MAKKITIRPFQITTNGVDLSKGLPERLKLLNWGENRLNTGEIVKVNDVSAKVFDENQRILGRVNVPIDYEHSTVKGTPAYERTKPNDPVAGNGRPFVIAGEGLFIDQVQTTPDGQKNAPNFKDLSPTPLLDEDNCVIAMHSVALTHTGAVEGLTLQDAALKALSAELQLKPLSTTSEPNAYKNGANHNYGFEPMDIKYFRDNDPEGMLKDKTDEQALEFIKAKWCGMCGKEGTITPKSMNQTPTWSDNWNAKVSELVTGAVTPLNATIAALTAQLAEKAKTAEEEQKQSIIADAIKEGRPVTLTAEQTKELSVSALKILVAQVPKGLIPLGPLRQPEKSGQSFKPLTALKPEEREVALETNRLRTLDSYRSLAAQLKRTEPVN